MGEAGRGSHLTIKDKENMKWRQEGKILCVLKIL
jgi:hypothetical protein